MASLVRSILDHGNGGVVIDIECHLSKGLPNIVIVGFANKAVDEAKERIRGAFSNSQLDLPRRRITLNLAPADLPKDGTGFDLPMAVSILLASGQAKQSPDKETVMLGELGLDGSLRPVRGIIGKILAARDQGITTFWLPTANLAQAQLIPNVKLLPINNLKELYLQLSDESELSYFDTKNGMLPTRIKQQDHNKVDFKEVVSQARAKRALEIAAAGQHNILLNGPPGTGKSMLAKALPSILPKLSLEEILEITHIHSLAGKEYDKIITTRPFRSPHHSASETAIVGGGQRPRPGEISLSHHGVLFFDELPEFNRSTIESLRQPLEDRVITIARAKDILSFPANFILVATANPCPCGFWGSTKPCICLPSQILNYQKKMSGPILDRIDLYVEVEDVEHERLLSEANKEQDSRFIAGKVLIARQTQYQRFRKLNSNLTNQELKSHAGLSNEAKNVLNKAAEKLQLSPRGYMRAVKVARTIADLDQSEGIEVEHITEALQYRRTSFSF